MKVFKILFVLFLFSLQANATGYAHNMFVAQKKLNNKKEAFVDKPAVSQLAKPKQEQVKAQKQLASPINTISLQLTDVLSAHSPTFEQSAVVLLDEKKCCNSLSTSMVSRVASFLKDSIYAFITSFH